MKHFTLVVALAFICLGIPFKGAAQANPLADKHYLFSIAPQFGVCSIQPTQNIPPVDGYAYTYKDLFIIDALFSAGRIIKISDAAKELFLLKSGIELNGRVANLNRSGTAFTYSEYDFAIPLSYDIRVKGKSFLQYYTSLDFDMGIYAASNLWTILRPDSTGSKSVIEEDPFSDLKLGIVGAVEFSMLDRQCHGHVFGIRTKFDVKNIWQSNNSRFNTHPLFNTIGLYYNLRNSTR